MSHSAKKRAKVLAAAGVTMTVDGAAKFFKISTNTIKRWRNDAKKSPEVLSAVSTGPVPQAVPPNLPESTAEERAEIRNAIIAMSVEEEVAAARKEIIRDLLKMRKAAVGRYAEALQRANSLVRVNCDPAKYVLDKILPNEPTVSVRQQQIQVQAQEQDLSDLSALSDEALEAQLRANEPSA